MRIKIITSIGTFTSDEIKNVSLEEVIELINKATADKLENLRVVIDGCQTYFSGEVIKNSVIKIIK